ncbi:hypothetical protein PIB30_054751 [Stylosanthes scabra]|uniref:Uncharacterized protein n=1 Tax=Stylosanthes scabra TaxID=79078 RepID=A0ABU6UMD1_9FABA|nr:hypothetical protein [Stylosanthes scabra]
MGSGVYALDNPYAHAPNAREQGKRKVTWCVRIRLTALRARQARDEAGPSNAAPHNDEVIEISSDFDSEQVLKYVPGEGAGIGEEEEEEVPKYVMGEGAMIEVLQPLNQERCSAFYQGYSIRRRQAI